MLDSKAQPPGPPAPDAHLHPETRLVHGGILRSQFGETSEALFLTQGFVYDRAETCEARFKNEDPGYQYTRYGNPTISMFEDRLAMLEGAEACRAVATGMAAVNGALMGLVKAGDHVVAPRAMFGSCRWIIEEMLPRFGVTSTLVDGTDLDQWRKAAATPNTTVFFLETPCNPTLEVLDIAAIAAIAHEAGALLIVDNVFATPLYQRPLALGADVVVYSATKHIDGQGRCMGGAILASKALIEERIQLYLRMTGPSISPFNAWVLLKSLELMPVRIARQAETAGRLADAMLGIPGVTKVIYPGREDHPQADVIARQMSGPSTLIAFEVTGGKDGAFRFQNALTLVSISNNLGDVKSLITHPATTTHSRFKPEERAALGITDGTLRLSVGLEHIDDLVADLKQAAAVL
ncbi:O-succinylhomoserine sulfhydrylase [Rhodoplanes sp. TEM]|uniref:O-succinylhomoserine sulfhydrylase n=1 Tax=Rhodoplanes tepidamans TaxID=200616 RepID=A0ABT5J5L5_RHOTP|nr:MULTISPECIES: O-succinylhomoserine sulfhydrylase [Rhodoplanes]MDC7784948.1 O-succinylhomoserine sulfhydrylase [Rhodoplanes tepidamans]MDC7983956.1 O-succinylhomoserine sulfhydrylase [Rhodoplanes sp. TEM]MDQ0353823.1 O-succinylhomoserine sulfhydrylase [Rhodoplanes tepidamans]